MEEKIVSKVIVKSSTFWFTVIIVMLMVLAAILEMNGIKMPSFVVVLLGVLGSVFVGAEKIKDATVTANKVLVEFKPEDVKGKQIVNDTISRWMAGSGVFLTSLYGILVQQGIHIDPATIGMINTIIVAFIGGEKYKNTRIIAASQIVMNEKK